MGCCATSDGGLYPLSANSAFQKPRDKEFLYEIIFPSRPLHVTITSAKNNEDAYITAVDELCPVENIVVNSKIIYVNGKLFEGYDIKAIVEFLTKEPLPLKLILCKPDGLGTDEIPE